MKLETFKKKAVLHFNKYIRLRDSQNGVFKCISCGELKDTKQMNAGHYYPSTHSATKFDEDNVHGQCIACNMYKSGNLTYYRKSLIEKIGIEKVEALDWKHSQPCKRDRFDYEYIIKTYKEKCKKLQK